MTKRIFCFLVRLLCAAAVFCAAPAAAYAGNETGTIITGDPCEPDEKLYTKEPLDPFDNGMKYSAVVYDNTNGLLTSAANAIAQTDEGFIWIGSYGGLVRYDGNTFERVLPDVITGVKFLYTDSRSRLWIGSSDSGAAVTENGSVLYWNESSGFPAGPVCAIAEDESGFVYFATKHGLYFVDNDLNLNNVRDERVREKAMCDLKRGADGLVYVVDKDGYVFTIKEGVIKQYNYSGCPEPIGILPVTENPGEILICDQTFIYYGAFNAEKPEMSSYDMAGPPVSDIKDLEYAGGMIWCCAGTGVCVFEPGKVGNSRSFRDISMSAIGHVMQDNQKNFWFTSTNHGVIKVTPNYFDDIYARYGINANVVNSTCMYKGQLIAGEDTGVVCIDETGQNAEPPQVRYIYHNNKLIGEFSDSIVSFFEGLRVRSLVKDSHERLWISTWQSGLYCLEGDSLYQYDTDCQDAALSSDHMRTVTETKDGSLLIVSKGGLDIMKDRRVIMSYGRNEGIENTDFLCAEAGPDNEILLGSDCSGIYIIRGDGTAENLSKKDGLGSDAVMRIKKDRSRDIFWIVTGNSIAYMTKDHKITTVTEFPYPDNFDILQNSRDEMWILSSNGIYVVPTEKMIENKDITPVHYGIENGLTRTSMPNSFSGLTESGNLYICGNTGVTKVNIETAFQDTPEIKAAIPYIDADGRRLYPDKNGNFNISSRVKKLTVYSYVLNYSLTTPDISYCLEGFDDSFITVSRKNLMPVDYINLSGGDYRFILKVSGGNGKEYVTVTAGIAKDKAFYEQPWFYIALILLNLLILAAIMKLIWTIRMKKLRQKHKEEVEKERINTELEMARKIQTGTMPAVFPPFPDRQEFDIYASVDPAKEVGGDFYDFFMTDEDHLCIVIADVSGKGVPAALFMMSAKIIISDFAEAGKTPAEILTAANAKLRTNNPEKMFVTVWLGILEISTGKLTASNAGHEYPMLMQPGGKFELLKDKHGPMLCFMKKLRYKEYETELKPGARLFLYTDGIPEATDSNEQMFGLDRLLVALNEKPDAPLKELLESVRNFVDSFVKEAEQFDDLTMLCLEYRNEPQNTDNILAENPEKNT